MADLFAAAPGAVVTDMGIGSSVVATATCLSTLAAPGSRELNQVHEATGLDDAQLDAIDAWYASRGGTYVVGVVPEDRDRLGPMLTRRGFTPTRAWTKFVHDPSLEEPAPATDLTIDAARPGEFGAVVVAGYGMPERMRDWIDALVGRPGWTCLIARDETGAAVGAGALHVGPDGGWLGLAATLPAARGRGAQRGLLSARLAVGRAAGADPIVTETGVAVPGSPQQSHRNIERAGFRAAYVREHLAAPGFPA